MSVAADRMPNFASTLIDTLIASNRGDRQAFTYNDRRYTFQDVAALMNRTGNMLVGLGVRPGSPVLLLLPGSPARVASVLGAIKAGAVPVIGAPAQSDALGRCVTVTKPAAVVVHETRLPEAQVALAGVPRDAVVVVGANPGQHKSFVDEVRGQASWLAAGDVRADAPAVGIWTGSQVELTTHAELAAFVGGTGTLRGRPAEAAAEIAAIGAMLRAFALGDEAVLA